MSAQLKTAASEEALNSGTKPKPLTLAEQRAACRAQLAAQRQVIAFNLMPKRSLTHRSDSITQYRSVTMRFLTQNPASSLKLALRLATLVIGARAAGAFNAGLQVYKLVQVAAKLR